VGETIDTDGEERRGGGDRASVVLQLQYRNAGHLLVSYCTNLSRGGLFVPSPDPLPPGSPITLTLQIPGEDEPVALDARVRWVRQFDADQGPAGMGLAFDDVDDVLGERIDHIVSSFSPLRVDLVGSRGAVLEHVAAQVRTLVSCETTIHAEAPDVEALAASDLVVVDLEGDADEGLALLDALHALPSAPPAVALCDPGASARWGHARRRARMVAVPVEAEELRRSVRDGVTQVVALRTEAASPPAADADESVNDASPDDDDVKN
jgi:uncharacterized protein (TIGR02266 family)